MIVIFFINAMIPLNHTRIQQKTDPTFQYGTRNLQIHKNKNCFIESIVGMNVWGPICSKKA